MEIFDSVSAILSQCYHPIYCVVIIYGYDVEGYKGANMLIVSEQSP